MGLDAQTTTRRGGGRHRGDLLTATEEIQMTVDKR
jgi:hypothetical protein